MLMSKKTPSHSPSMRLKNLRRVEKRIDEGLLRFIPKEGDEDRGGKKRDRKKRRRDRRTEKEGF